MMEAALTEVSAVSFNDAQDLRSLLGVSDDEGTLLFSSVMRNLLEQRKKIKAADLGNTVLVDNGMISSLTMQVRWSASSEINSSMI